MKTLKKLLDCLLASEMSKTVFKGIAKEWLKQKINDDKIPVQFQSAYQELLEELQEE